MKWPILLLAVLLAPCWRQAAAETNSPSTQIVVKQAKIPAQLGDAILVGVHGQFADDVKKKLTNDSASTRPNLRLYLNGIAMPGLTPEILPPEALGTLPTNAIRPTLVLQFTLERNANDEDNRKAWDKLLRRVRYGPQFLQVGVGLDGNIPHLAAFADSNKDPLQFQVRPLWYILSVIGIGAALFCLLMWWAVSGSMLRESGPGSAHSLGKSQMAFWGLLVALCFVGVWIVSIKMERIPPQMLVLLGISGVTGLSSIMIGSGKRAAADSDAKQMKRKEEELEAQEAALQAEQQALTNEKAAAGANWPIEKEKRLASLGESLNALRAQILEVRKAILARLNEAAPSTSENWWKDIISDATGPSFHRFQVVLWTLILGVIFVWTVASTFSMPEFDTTLLLLMGISNGTYLGFKIPEKQGESAPATAPAAHA